MLALTKRLDRLEQTARGTGERILIGTCDEVRYWRATDYGTTLHGMDACGNCVPPDGAPELTRADVDKLKQLHNIIVIHYVKHEDKNYDNT